MELIKSKIRHIPQQEIINLSLKETKLLRKLFANFNQYFFCKIDGKIYHKKKLIFLDIANELLGKLITEYFKSDTVKSEIIYNEKQFYLLSENFIKKGNFYTELNQGVFPRLEFDEDERLDLFNLDRLDKIQKDRTLLDTDQSDLKKIQYQLKSMIVNDFIRKQSDRWYYNFLIAYFDNHCKLMPLFDFEFSFLECDEALENSFKFDFSDKAVVDYVRKDEQFQELLHLAMDLDMKKIFERLFDEYPIRLNEDELVEYENIITNQKEEIKGYKLIK